MEPIPETALALEAMDPVPDQGDDALLDQLRSSGDSIRSIVPDCVGFSLARLHQDLVFTMVATAAEIAALDAVQYLTDGPCLHAAVEDEVIETWPGDVLSEERWRVFSSAATGLGIQSTLTLPIRNGSSVEGSVNLYARSPRAFDGHHVALAALFGAWAPGAVANADLAFDTRLIAQSAPGIVAESSRVETAIGLLAFGSRTEVDVAEERFDRAARQAGISRGMLATSIITMFGARGPGH